jgi:hypothetical protein
MTRFRDWRWLINPHIVARRVLLLGACLICGTGLLPLLSSRVRETGEREEGTVMIVRVVVILFVLRGRAKTLRASFMELLITEALKISLAQSSFLLLPTKKLNAASFLSPSLSYSSFSASRFDTLALTLDRSGAVRVRLLNVV